MTVSRIDGLLPVTFVIVSALLVGPVEGAVDGGPWSPRLVLALVVWAALLVGTVIWLLGLRHRDDG
jgi:hypothetical protein